MILKLGSKGNEVKRLQEALGLKVDGIFGPNTEKKVKEFQKANGLIPDGIVGDKTIGLLYSNDIILMPLKVHITKKYNRPIKYIVIHYTAGGNSKKGAAKSCYKVFTAREASSDFAVDDEDIVQFNTDIKNSYCLAVGGRKYPNTKGGSLYNIATNANCISIEMCSTLKSGTTPNAANHTGWTISEKVINNTIKLVRILMKGYNIPLSNVIRHYDVNGKLCPGVVGWNNEPLYNPNTGELSNLFNNSTEWEKFKSKI